MTWLEEIRSRVQENRRLLNTDIEESMLQALDEYSGYQPNYTDVMLVSNGTKVFTIPEQWKNGFSQIVTVEYPLAENLILDNPNNYPIPAIRETSDYSLLTVTNPYKLLITFDVPIDDTIRIRYTLPYTLSDYENIPGHYRSAVINLATAYSLLKLSSIYAQSTDLNLQAESVDYKERASEYTRLANWYKDRWELVMGLGKYAIDKEDNMFDADDKTISRSYLKSYAINRDHRMFRPSNERKRFFL